MISDKTVEFLLGGFMLAGGSYLLTRGHEPTFGKVVKEHLLPTAAVVLGAGFLIHRATSDKFSLSVGG